MIGDLRTHLVTVILATVTSIGVQLLNFTYFFPEQHGGMIPTMPGEMYGNSHEVYDVYSRGYDDR